MAYDLTTTTAYIREAARRRGIDPDIAVRVARSEGLARGTWQSNLSKGGRREPSYGPFQFLVGGEGTGYPTGMGNDFKRDTGLDPSDPRNVNATIDYAMDRASKDGWGAWYGAAKVGVGRRDGIGGARAVGPGAKSLQQVVAEREMAGGSGSSQVVGGAGDDTLAPGSPVPPTVEIGLSPEQKRQAAGYDAVTESGMKMGQNARNIWDVAGGLAQVWAGTSGARKLEEGEHSELVKAYAARGLTPDEQVIASAKGGREGLADVLTARKMNEIRASERAEAQDWRREERDYQRGRDAVEDERWQKTYGLQERASDAKATGFRTLTADEVTQRGLTPGQYQEGPDKRLYPISDGKGPTINVDTGRDESEFAKKAAGRQVDRFGAVADLQSGAANTVQTIPVMRELLTQAPTGPIAGRLAERFPGFSTAGDAFTATVNQIAPTLRIPGSGAMSDRDMDILMRSFPRLSSDPTANGLVMDVFERKAQLNLQRAAIANQALNLTLTPAQADAELAKLDQVPLFDDAMRARLTGQPPADRGGSGSLVPGSDGGGQRYEDGVPVGAQNNGPAPVRRARNPKTGEILELRNGQWVPAR